MASPTQKALATLATQPVASRQQKQIKKKVFANVVNDRQILDAMVAVGGVGKAAASYLGIPHRALLNRIKKNPWLQSELEVVREDRLDFAESKLMQLISEGNVNAITFYLRTVGKDRGFTEQKQDIAVNTNVAVAVVPGLLDPGEWATLSKKYQEEKDLEVHRQLREMEDRVVVEHEVTEINESEYKVVELFRGDDAKTACTEA